MKRFLFTVLSAVAMLSGACGGAPLPVVPEAPPAPPEPVLRQRGEVFVYEVNGRPVCGMRGPGSVEHAVRIDHATVHAWTPPGWTSSYAGNAAWFELADDVTARFVVYPEDDVEAAFRDEWYDRDRADADIAVGALHALETPRRPRLYAYARRDDGRLGMVYALRTGGAAGVIVHGVWPAERDPVLRPLVAAIANDVTVARD